MKFKNWFVYILASKKYGTLYIGMTDSLTKRGWQHKENFVDGFTKKYQIRLLVYYEVHENVMSALTREKQLKKWNRDWKIRLIEEMNPLWEDLYPSLA